MASPAPWTIIHWSNWISQKLPFHSPVSLAFFSFSLAISLNVFAYLSCFSVPLAGLPLSCLPLAASRGNEQVKFLRLFTVGNKCMWTQIKKEQPPRRGRRFQGMFGLYVVVTDYRCHRWWWCSLSIEEKFFFSQEDRVHTVNNRHSKISITRLDIYHKYNKSKAFVFLRFSRKRKC